MDFKITHSVPFKVSRPLRPTPAPLVRLWEARCVCALVTAQPKLQESSGFQAGEASMTITEMTSVGRLVGARWGRGDRAPLAGSASARFTFRSGHDLCISRSISRSDEC